MTAAWVSPWLPSLAKVPKPKAGILTPLLRVKTGPVTAGDAILYVCMCVNVVVVEFVVNSNIFGGVNLRFGGVSSKVGVDFEYCVMV